MGALHNYKQGCFNIYTEIQKLYMRQLLKGFQKPYLESDSLTREQVGGWQFLVTP